jgi:hypothetical protein
MYGGAPYVGWRTRRIYHGMWGTAPFQSLYEPAPSWLAALPMMPEWYLLILVLLALSALSMGWVPLRLAIPPLTLAVLVPVAQAARSAARVSFQHSPASRLGRLKRRLLTMVLHLLQPLARLCGRCRHGLTLWRQRVHSGFALPRRWTADLWSGRTRSVEERLESVERALREQGAVPQRGDDFASWDLEVRGGMLGAARMFVAVEHHGNGRQLLRLRWWPRCSVGGLLLTGLFALLASAADRDQSWLVAVVLAGVTLLLAAWTLRQCAAATGAFLAAVRTIERAEKP